MKMTSFSINGRAVSRLSINGREVSLKQEPVFSDALCFTAEEPGSTIKINRGSNAPTVDLQTSFDGKNWTSHTVGSTITLADVGDKVYFKAIDSNERMAVGAGQGNYFGMTGRISASGNVNSLLEEDEDTARIMSLTGRNYCFAGLFYRCSSLIKAPELPATTLADRCYQDMFNGCSNLNYVKVPFTNWDPANATTNWLPNNAGTFECPWDLITNTAERTASTVPASWSMVAV